MALAVQPATVLGGAVRMPTWLGGIGVISGCLTAFVVLVPPALATVAPGPAPQAVTVRLVGELSTAGLPETPAVSRLSLHNEGAGSVSWSARAALSGAGAAGVRIDSWLPGERPCTTPTRLLSASDWSRDPVPPGGSVDLCVRVTASGTTGGTVTPQVTVAARPADS